MQICCSIVAVVLWSCALLCCSGQPTLQHNATVWTNNSLEDSTSNITTARESPAQTFNQVNSSETNADYDSSQTTTGEANLLSADQIGKHNIDPLFHANEERTQSETVTKTISTTVNKSKFFKDERGNSPSSIIPFSLPASESHLLSSSSTATPVLQQPTEVYFSPHTTSQFNLQHLPRSVFSGERLTIPRPWDHTATNSYGMQDSCIHVDRCEPLQYDKCLGASLPYNHTSMAGSGLHSQRAASAELVEWSWSLRQLPRCWTVVQPYLCLVFFPPCDNDTLTLHLPPQDLCEAVRGPCRLVEEGQGWPEYMKCSSPALAVRAGRRSNATALQRSCTSTSSLTSVRDAKFNSSSGTCVVPLVPTPRPEAWYDGVRGCGLPCRDPVFSREEAAGFHSFLAIMAGLSVACCAFTVLTYLLEWRCGGSRRYPSVLLLYLCGCCLVAGVAMLAQFHGAAREHVTCHADGTLRRHEPSTESNMSCVVVFVCLYYFGVAAAVWLLLLAYSWHSFFNTLVCGDTSGCSSSAADRGSAYYHLFAWSLPLVLTITTLAMGQVSADHLHGVCFLSPSLSVRVPLLLLPLCITIGTTAFFLVKGILRLCQLKLECSAILTTQDHSRIVESVVRLTVLLLTLAASGLLTLYCHVSHYADEPVTGAALRQYILCHAGLAPTVVAGSECSVSARPSLGLFKLQVLAWSCPPLVLASFCWTSSTAHVWRTFFRRLMGVQGSVEQHAVAPYDARAPLDACVGLSGSLQQQRHGGVKVEAEPTGVGALMHPLSSRAAPLAGVGAPLPFPGVLHHNTDSEHSISTRYSIESGFQYYSSSRQQLKGRMRRHSVDSQLSFHVSDVEREAARHTMVRFSSAAPGQQRASLHSYTSRTSRVSGVSRSGWLGRKLGRTKPGDSRRGSFTSEDSSFSAVSSVLVTGVGMGAEDTLFSNMMRRLNLSSSAASSTIPAATALQHDLQPQGGSSGSCPSVRQATVGVQTSLEGAFVNTSSSGSPRAAVDSADKAVQVCLPFRGADAFPSSSDEGWRATDTRWDGDTSLLAPHAAGGSDHGIDATLLLQKNLRNSHEETASNAGGKRDNGGYSAFPYFTPAATTGNNSHKEKMRSTAKCRSERSKGGSSSKHNHRRRKRKQSSSGRQPSASALPSLPYGGAGVTETSFVSTTPNYQRTNSTDLLLLERSAGAISSSGQRCPSSVRGVPSSMGLEDRHGRGVGSAALAGSLSVGVREQSGRSSSRLKHSTGGRSSALAGSRGTCLDAAETISTILDVEDLSDSDC